jgi:hypothetical protein
MRRYSFFVPFSPPLFYPSSCSRACFCEFVFFSCWECVQGKTNNSPQTLQITRRLLDESNYTQIPQLSCGVDIELENMPLMI